MSKKYHYIKLQHAISEVSLAISKKKDINDQPRYK